MNLDNPLYKNQGIHANLVLFTFDEDKLKILLIKRTNEPFNNMWALPGGAVYNNETIDNAIKRELKEKTGITNIDCELFNVFSKIDRAPNIRMVGIGYFSIIDKSAVTFIKKTKKTQDADWFDVDCIPKLAYDHNEMILDALKFLKVKIWQKGILKTLFPSGVTIPELYKLYTKILGVSLDRRNFRKKLILSEIITNSNKFVKNKGVRPSKLYYIQ